MDEHEQESRQPIELYTLPSDMEGFTHDVFINGDRRFSVNLEDLSERGLLELISESMQFGAELLLADMGKFVDDTASFKEQ